MCVEWRLRFLHTVNRIHTQAASAVPLRSDRQCPCSASNPLSHNAVRPRSTQVRLPRERRHGNASQTAEFAEGNQTVRNVFVEEGVIHRGWRFDPAVGFAVVESRLGSAAAAPAPSTTCLRSSLKLVSFLTPDSDLVPACTHPGGVNRTVGSSERIKVAFKTTEPPGKHVGL